jgi:hypothetical protein
MASPKKANNISPGILKKMDEASDLLFEVAEQDLKNIMFLYVHNAQKLGNEDMLIDLVNRLMGKPAPRIQPEQDNHITLNILTHGGNVDTYRLSSPGKAIDADYDINTDETES